MNRREFEESVSIPNEALPAYLDREETNAQSVFPHYFVGHGCQVYTFDKSRSETILLICFCGSLSTG